MVRLRHTGLLLCPYSDISDIEQLEILRGDVCIQQLIA